jgi:hypothetical protein
VVDSENLTTLFVVVSKYAVKDWETTYETLCEFVVSGREQQGGRVEGRRWW